MQTSITPEQLRELIDFFIGWAEVQEALILAMKKEKVAFKLYTDLAAAVSSADLKNTFLSLAQEEAKHKLRFEVEYDNEIMGEN